MSEPILSLLIELQRLKRLDRTGWTLRGLPNGTESVAAHSFGVSVTAMLLADRLRGEGVVVDIEKVLLISLRHLGGKLSRICPHCNRILGGTLKASESPHRQIVGEIDLLIRCMRVARHYEYDRGALEAICKSAICRFMVKRLR